MPKKATAGLTGIKHTRHQQKQKNNPTEQAASIAEELAPRPCVPNVRAVDRGAPRLSWQRGDNDDTHATEALPLFVREKIVPLENITKLTQLPDPKDDLFHDLNGLPPDQRYEFYEHDVNWRNRIIHADSTAAMASLLEFDGLHGQVQTIYFDPPYGINFNANFQASTRQPKATKEVVPQDPAAIKAFRDTYANGIHTYLDTIKRIVTYGRELLADSGSLFLQIGNDNQPELSLILNEVFGKENRVAIIPFRKASSSTAKLIPEVCDYILWYAKDKSQTKYNQIYRKIKDPGKEDSNFQMELDDGTDVQLTKEQKENPHLIPPGAKLFYTQALYSPGHHEIRSQPYKYKGKLYRCPTESQWQVSMEGLDRLTELNRLHGNEDGTSLRLKKYVDEVTVRAIHNMWNTSMQAQDKHYVVETAESVIERCILMSSAPGDLILDPTCGSGTTAFVAEKHGRRWITTDTSRTAINLARQRVATAIYDFYLLQDSPEGAKAEESQKGTPRTGPFTHSIAHGFVYERVQAVSTSSLAYDKPKEPTLLINYPIPKSGTKRVAGPFTIELSSPHRYLPLSDRHDPPVDSDRPTPTANATEAILNALRTTGISDPQDPGNPKARIRIDGIEEYIPGQPSRADEDAALDETLPYITHTGQLRLTDPKKGVRHEPCTILIAPPDITVPPTWINNAISDTNVDRRYKHLVVLAFSYEATNTTAYTRQRIQVHRAQVNQDITIGLTDTKGDRASDLKSKRGDTSIIMVGQPEYEVRKANLAEHYEVEVHGTVTFDPQTQNVSSAGTEAIEYWAVDTNYDGNSFHARDVHFPHPTDKQLMNLRTQLGAKLDSDRWANFIGYVSRPFPKPTTGEIMIRVITTTGTEMEVVETIR